MNNKAFANLEMVGETVVVLAAAMWITHLSIIPIAFAVGAILMAVGRFAQVQNADTLVLKRLYRQRKWAVVLLLISAVFMFVTHTTYVGYNMYVFPSSWIIFFVMFAVIEIYTTCRLLHVTKEK